MYVDQLSPTVMNALRTVLLLLLLLRSADLIHILTTFAARSAVGLVATLDCRKKTSETGSSGVMLTLKISFLLSADAFIYYFNHRFRYRSAVSLGATFDCRKQLSETRSAGSRATKASIIEVQVVIYCRVLATVVVALSARGVVFACPERSIAASSTFH